MNSEVYWISKRKEAKNNGRFCKSVVKNFSKEYRQQPLPTDLQAEVKARFHKEKKRYTWLRFRNRSLQSSLVVACGFVLSVNLFPGFSEAARNIPVLDKIVQLVTIKTLTAKKQESEVNIDVPKIQTSQESSVADTLNKNTWKKPKQNFNKSKGNCLMVLVFQSLEIMKKLWTTVAS